MGDGIMSYNRTCWVKSGSKCTCSALICWLHVSPRADRWLTSAWRSSPASACASSSTARRRRCARGCSWWRAATTRPTPTTTPLTPPTCCTPPPTSCARKGSRLVEGNTISPMFTVLSETFLEGERKKRVEATPCWVCWRWLRWKYQWGITNGWLWGTTVCYGARVH